MWREPWFWIIVAVVVILLFGAPKLPVFAKSLGQSMNIFRKEMKQTKADADASSDDDAKPAAS